MKDWIISIVSVVLITSIVCLILPQGKMGKFVKNIFSILTMLVIIKPLIYLKDGNFNFEQFAGSDIVIQTDFLDYIYQKRVDEQTKICLKIIEENGIKNAKVDINFEIENQDIKIKLVQINLQDSVIISDKGHIDIKEEIVAEISSYLFVEKEVVIIYEWSKQKE